MIQGYKDMVRYWVATRFGDLETAREEHICEIICPDCEMKTAIDITDNSEQSCYFCNGNLIQKPAPTIQETNSLSETIADQQPVANQQTDRQQIKTVS